MGPTASVVVCATPATARCSLRRCPGSDHAHLATCSLGPASPSWRETRQQPGRDLHRGPGPGNFRSPVGLFAYFPGFQLALLATTRSITGRMQVDCLGASFGGGGLRPTLRYRNAQEIAFTLSGAWANRKRRLDINACRDRRNRFAAAISPPTRAKGSGHHNGTHTRPTSPT